MRHGKVITVIFTSSIVSSENFTNVCYTSDPPEEIVTLLAFYNVLNRIVIVTIEIDIKLY